jgi:Tfp pilus assembly PilM family ATPase/Tfp pilus assembly protein PilN
MFKNILSIIKRNKVIGLYIGPDTVDVVVLKATLTGPKLVKFGQTYIYPKEKQEGILPDTVDTGVKAEPQKGTEKKSKDELIIDAIKRVFKENNVKPGNVVSAISSEQVMVRYFQMPKIPRQEWSSAINFEAKRYIPFRMEDVVSDFQVIQHQPRASSMDVVFVAVKQKTIEQVVSLLEQAGVKPIIVEPAPFSLIRAFNTAGQINLKVNTAIISIDTRSATINILRNGVPYLIRDIPLDETPPGEKSLEPIFEKLLAEIKLSFDFHEKQFPSEAIDKIIIYSQLPLENWHELVGKELQVSVEVGDPLRGVRIKKEVVPPRLAVTFGLALRGLSSPFIDVNLCKERLFLYKSKELFLRVVFLEASAAVFVLILLKVMFMRTITPLTEEYNRTLSERPKVEVNIKDESIVALERMKNGMEAKKDLLEDIFSTRAYFTTRLIDFAELVPGNIWLTEVDFEEKVDKKDISKVSRRLDIKGYCIIDGKMSETEAINNFLIDLKEGGLLKQGMSKADIVSVVKTEMQGKKVASFEILVTGP